MGRKRGVHYEPGGFYRADDRSGFVTRAGETKPEWNGLIVDRKLWEPRQPQDFVKGVPDNQSVPDPRSRLPTPFDGPIYTSLSRAAAPNDTFLYLEAIAGISADDSIGVMLDTGAYFKTTVQGNATNQGVNISPAMPNYAAAQNAVVDYSANGGVA